MEKPIINRILWAIIVLAVNFILAVVFYILLLVKNVDSSVALNVFFYSFVLFSGYGFYLIFARLSALKISIYFAMIVGLVLSMIFVEDINIHYSIDDCFDKGSYWNYQLKECAKTHKEY